jgi:hypothetical protein
MRRASSMVDIKQQLKRMYSDYQSQVIAGEDFKKGDLVGRSSAYEHFRKELKSLAERVQVSDISGSQRAKNVSMAHLGNDVFIAAWQEEESSIQPIKCRIGRFDENTNSVEWLTDISTVHEDASFTNTYEEHYNNFSVIKVRGQDDYTFIVVFGDEVDGNLKARVGYYDLTTSVNWLTQSILLVSNTATDSVDACILNTEDNMIGATYRRDNGPGDTAIFKYLEWQNSVKTYIVSAYNGGSTHHPVIHAINEDEYKFMVGYRDEGNSWYHSFRAGQYVEESNTITWLTSETVPDGINYAFGNFQFTEDKKTLATCGTQGASPYQTRIKGFVYNYNNSFEEGSADPVVIYDPYSEGYDGFARPDMIYMGDNIFAVFQNTGEDADDDPPNYGWMQLWKFVPSVRGREHMDNQWDAVTERIPFSKGLGSFIQKGEHLENGKFAIIHSASVDEATPGQTYISVFSYKKDIAKPSFDGFESCCQNTFNLNDTLDIEIKKIGDNFIVAFQDETDSNYGKIRIGNWSQEAGITWLTGEININDTAEVSNGFSIAVLNDTDFTLGYLLNGTEPYTIIGRQSGDTVQWLTNPTTTYTDATASEIKIKTINEATFVVSYVDNSESWGAIKVGSYQAGFANVIWNAIAEDPVGRKFEQNSASLVDLELFKGNTVGIAYKRSDSEAVMKTFQLDEKCLCIRWIASETFTDKNIQELDLERLGDESFVIVVKDENGKNYNYFGRQSKFDDAGGEYQKLQITIPPNSEDLVNVTPKENAFDGESTYMVNGVAAAKLTNNKFVGCWVYDTVTVPDEGFARVAAAEIINGEITFGESMQFSETEDAAQIAITNIDSDHFAIVYRDTNGDSRLFVGIAKGKNITKIGPEQIYSSVAGSNAMVSLDSTRFALVYSTGADRKIRIATFTPDFDITLTNEVDISGAVVNNVLKLVDTDKLALVGGDGGSNGYIRIINIDGTDVTVGDQQLIWNKANGGKDNRVGVLDSETLLLTNQTGDVKVAKVYGRNVTFGPDSKFWSVSALEQEITVFDSNFAVIAFADSGASNVGRLMPIKINGMEIELDKNLYTDYAPSPGIGVSPSSFNIDRYNSVLFFSDQNTDDRTASAQLILRGYELNSKYFNINSPYREYYVWFKDRGGPEVTDIVFRSPKKQDTREYVEFLGNDTEYNSAVVLDDNIFINFYHAVNALAELNTVKNLNSLTVQVSAQVNTGATSYIRATKMNNRHAVVAFIDDADSSYPKTNAVRVNQAADSMITGTESAFDSVAYARVDIDRLADGKFIMVGSDHSTFGRAKVGFLTGDASTSFGTEYDFLSGDAGDPKVIGLDENKFVVIYRDGNDSYSGKAIVGIIDPADESISYGTPTSVGTITQDYYDIVALSSTKFAIVYANSPNYYLRSRAFSVSGDSITSGSSVVHPESPTVASATLSVTRLSDTRYAIAWSDSTNNYLHFTKADIDGITVTFDDVFDVNSTPTGHISISGFNKNYFIISYLFGVGSSRYRIAQTFDDELSGNYFYISSNLEDYYVWYAAGQFEAARINTYGEDSVLSDIGGKYFTISTTVEDYYVWYDVDDGDSDPGPLGRVGIEVDISANDDAETVATATRDQINTDAGTECTATYSAGVEEETEIHVKGHGLSSRMQLASSSSADYETLVWSGNMSDTTVRKLDDTHYVVAGIDLSDSNRGKTRVITLDPITKILSTNDSSNLQGNVHWLEVGVFDSENVVYIYKDTGTTGTELRHGTIESDYSVTVAPDVDVNPNNSTGQNVIGLDSTHAVMGNYDVISARWEARVITRSGSSLSAPNQYVVSNEATSYGDSELAKLDSTRFAYGYSNNGKIYTVKIGVITSGDVITFGSAYQPESGVTSGSGHGIELIDADKLVCFYRDQGNNRCRAVVGTVANDDEITWGTPVTVFDDDGEGLELAVIDTTHFIATVKAPNDGNSGKIIACSVSGTTITPDNANTWLRLDMGWHGLCSAENGINFLTVFETNTDNDQYIRLGEITEESLDGSYFTIKKASSASKEEDYYVWYNTTGSSIDPSPGGTGIEVVAGYRVSTIPFVDLLGSGDTLPSSPETIGYMFVEVPESSGTKHHGTHGNSSTAYDIGETPVEVAGHDDAQTTEAWGTAFTSKPAVVLVNSSTGNGSDGIVPVVAYDDTTNSVLASHADEDTIDDSEMNHADESFHWIAFESADVETGGSGVLKSEWGTETGVNNDAWNTISFTNTYTDPVIIATVLEEASTFTDPVVVRVRNLSSSSVEIRVEDDGHSGSALANDVNVAWFVGEKGSYQLDDGTKVTLGTLDTTTSHVTADDFPTETKGLSFPNADDPFDSTVLLFSTLQSCPNAEDRYYVGLMLEVQWAETPADVIGVAEATERAINAVDGFTATRLDTSSEYVEVVNDYVGTLTDATDEDTGFDLNVTVQGKLPFVRVENDSQGAVDDAADVDTGFVIENVQQGRAAGDVIDPGATQETTSIICNQPPGTIDGGFFAISSSAGTSIAEITDAIILPGDEIETGSYWLLNAPSTEYYVWYKSTGSTFAWDGSVDSAWDTNGNWDLSGHPGDTNNRVDDVDILFGAGSSNDITLGSGVTLNGQIRDLTISELGRTLTLGRNFAILGQLEVGQGGFGGTGTLAMSGYDIGVENVLLQFGGTITTGGGTITVKTSWNNQGATFTHGNGLVVFDNKGGENQVTVGGDNFYDVEVTTGSAIELQDNCTIDNDLLNNGTIYENGFTLTVTGTTSGTGTIEAGAHPGGADPDVEDPDIAGKTGIQVNMLYADDANTVAGKVQTAINAEGDFGCVTYNNRVGIVGAVNGNATNASDGNSGFTITTFQSGTSTDPEVTEAQAVADSGSSLDAKYWKISSPKHNYHIYYQVAATGTPKDWTGGFNNDWSWPPNWNPVFAPDQTIDVTIPNTGTNPVMDINGTVHSITLNANADLRINSKVLDIYGDFTVYGYGLSQGISGDIKFNGITRLSVNGWGLGNNNVEVVSGAVLILEDNCEVNDLTNDGVIYTQGFTLTVNGTESGSGTKDTTTKVIVVDISENDTAATVATNTKNAIDGYDEAIRVTNTSNGNVTDAVNVDAGVDITVVNDGSGSTPEVTDVVFPNSGGLHAKHWKIYSPSDEYHVYYQLNAAGATKTWTGVFDNDWDDPFNWSTTPLGVPDADNDIVVPNVGTSLEMNVDGECHDVNVTSTTYDFRTHGETLTVYGDFTTTSNGFDNGITYPAGLLKFAGVTRLTTNGADLDNVEVASGAAVILEDNCQVNDLTNNGVIYTQGYTLTIDGTETGTGSKDTTTIPIVINVSHDGTVSDVANATQSAIDGEAAFSASLFDFTATISSIRTTNASAGAVDDASDVNSGTVPYVYQQGITAGITDYYVWYDVDNNSEDPKPYLMEVTEIDFTGAAPAGLDGTYMTLDSLLEDWYLWFDLDDGSSDPAPADRHPLEVDIATGDSASQMATKTVNEINLNCQFNAEIKTGSPNVVRIWNSPETDESLVGEAIVGDAVYEEGEL